MIRVGFRLIFRIFKEIGQNMDIFCTEISEVEYDGQFLIVRVVGDDIPIIITPHFAQQLTRCFARWGFLRKVDLNRIRSLMPLEIK